MKRLKYQIQINCPVSLVYDTMLGLTDKSTYNEWTSGFSPTSSFEGTWETSSKMLFISVNDKGEKSGMVSRILTNDKHKFVSIEHYGILKSGEEITEGPEVDDWTGTQENYSFKEENGKTTVTIEMDAAEEHEEYMNKLYPNALSKLKDTCHRLQSSI